MKETKFDATQGIRVFGNDQEIENMLIQLTQDTTIKELSKIFPLYIRRVWLKKQIYKWLDNLMGNFRGYAALLMFIWRKAKWDA